MTWGDWILTIIIINIIVHTILGMLKLIWRGILYTFYKDEINKIKRQRKINNENDYKLWDKYKE